jgi:hypothetical protein
MESHFVLRLLHTPNNDRVFSVSGSLDDTTHIVYYRAAGKIIARLRSLRYLLHPSFFSQCPSQPSGDASLHTFSNCIASTSTGRFGSSSFTMINHSQAIVTKGRLRFTLSGVRFTDNRPHGHAKQRMMALHRAHKFHAQATHKFQHPPTISIQRSLQPKTWGHSYAD